MTKGRGGGVDCNRLRGKHYNKVHVLIRLTSKCNYKKDETTMLKRQQKIKPRPQSSLAISDMTSTVKLVGKIRRGRLPLSRSVTSLLW